MVVGALSSFGLILGFKDFVLDGFGNNIEVFAGITIWKLASIPSVKVRVVKFLITAVVILDFSSGKSCHFEHQIQILVQNEFEILG